MLHGRKGIAMLAVAVTTMMTSLTTTFGAGASAAETFSQDNLAMSAKITSVAQPKLVDRLRDGRVDWNHHVPGSAYLKEYGGWGDVVTFTWDQPVHITRLAWVQKNPPVVGEYAKAQLVGAMAQDDQGQYTIPVVLPVATPWQAMKAFGHDCEVAQWAGLDVTTRSIQMIYFVKQGKWSQLGEMVITGTPASQARSAQDQARSADASPSQPALPQANPVTLSPTLTIQSENPWHNTQGGTLAVPPAALLTHWPITMLGGDTEQRLIALRHQGDQPAKWTVSVRSDLPVDRAGVELAVMVPLQSREHGVTLVNYFTEAQLKTFQGKLPASFLRQQEYQDFPTLRLTQANPVRLWLTVRSFNVEDGQPLAAGRYRVWLDMRSDAGQTFTQEIPVRVLGAQIPRRPVLQVMSYGGVNDLDSRLHYSTISQGYKDYGFTNFLAHTGLWGVRNQLLPLSRNNPTQFRQIIASSMERYDAVMAQRGYSRDQILVEILDEPFDRTADLWVAVAQGIKAVRPDARIIANPPAHWPEGNMPTTLDGTFRKLAPYVDVWMPYSRHYEDPAMLAFLKATGKPLWFYNNCTVQTARKEGAIVDTYRRFGWLAAAYKLDGMGIWSAHFPVGDPWDDFDKTQAYTWPDAAIVFKSDDHPEAGAMSTRHWASWREAVEDVAIHRMIQHAIDTLEIEPARRQRMRDWLEESPRRMLASPTPQVIEAIRDQAMELLDY